jgi:hypothetical protein
MDAELLIGCFSEGAFGIGADLEFGLVTTVGAIMQRVGDAVTLVEPVAEIDQPAAVAAEWAPNRCRLPAHAPVAGGTVDDLGHGRGAIRAAQKTQQVR